MTLLPAKEREYWPPQACAESSVWVGGRSVLPLVRAAYGGAG